MEERKRFNTPNHQDSKQYEIPFSPFFRAFLPYPPPPQAKVPETLQYPASLPRQTEQLDGKQSKKAAGGQSNVNQHTASHHTVR